MGKDHDRLDSHFSVVGAFWAPESPEAVRTGILSSDKRTITFTTAPKYSRDPALASVGPDFFNRTREKLPTLHGFTQDGLCTLCDLSEVDRPGLLHDDLKQSIVSISYRVSICVNGMLIGGSRDKCLNSARYVFTGLSDWLPKATSVNWGNEQITLKVPFKYREIIDFSLKDNRVRVQLKAFSHLTGKAFGGTRLSKSVAFVDIESPTPESLVWYFDIAGRLENLFSLLTGTSLSLEKFFVYRAEESGYINAKRSSYARPFDPRDCVQCTDSQLATSISVWLSESQEFRRVESIALGVLRKSKLFWETEFLSLAQALEGAHRVTTRTNSKDRMALRKVRRKIVDMLEQENVDPFFAERVCTLVSHANDPTFASRLTELCGRISSLTLQKMKIEPAEFVANVVTTRNFYTHAGGRPEERRKKKLVNGTELFLLNQKMRSLLRGVLLLRLGIPEEQISAALVREATRWSIL
jgi:hypothetical protein